MRIDRTALYEQVWQEPLKTLAPKFGVSDVALRKKCIDALIPVPERGYRARHAASSEQLRMTSLVELDEG